MAAAVVSAHNHVLRRWLRGDAADPVREVDEAMRQVISLFTSPQADTGSEGSTLLLFRTSQPLDALLPAIRQLLETGER
jgi:hypothetical protein